MFHSSSGVHKKKRPLFVAHAGDFLRVRGSEGLQWLHSTESKKRDPSRHLPDQESSQVI